MKSFIKTLIFISVSAIAVGFIRLWEWVGRIEDAWRDVEGEK